MLLINVLILDGPLGDYAELSLSGVIVFDQTLLLHNHLGDVLHVHLAFIPLSLYLHLQLIVYFIGPIL